MIEERQILQMLLAIIKGLKKVRDGDLLMPALDEGHKLLIKIAMEAGINPPANLVEFCQWIQKPCSEWGVKEVTEFFPDRLYDCYGGVSFAAEDLLEIHVSVEEGDQKFMAEIVSYCHEQYQEDKKYQEYYANIRSFVTSPQNAVIAKKDLVSFQVLIQDDNLRNLFLNLYEELPLHKDNYRLCSHCGWTMTFAKGFWRCHSRTCNKEADKTNLAQLPASAICRLTPGIHRFVLVPGLAEQKLAVRLRREGYKVEVYPEIDKYDLRVVIGTVVIDFDVKEYSNPRRLVEYIENENILNHAGKSKFHANTYIVIPGHLTDRRSGYLTRIKQELKGRKNAVNIITERMVKGLLEGVRRTEGAQNI